MPVLSSGRPAAAEALRKPPPVPSAQIIVSRLRAEWRRVARVLCDPAVELDADEFVGVLDVYRRLKAYGAAIDPMAEALIIQMALQVAAGEMFLDG